MLVDFRVRNYRSFADEAFIQMDAAKAFKEHPECLIETSAGKYLKSLAIYGANASGKSNLISAVSAFRKLVLTSAKNNSTDRIATHPFALSDENLAAPTMYEIRFVIDGLFHRYGCEVTAEKIVSEWLFVTEKFGTATGRKIFTREEGRIDYGKSYRGARVGEAELLPNTLLLSRLDQMNAEVPVRVVQWMKKLAVVSALQDERYEGFSVKQLEEADNREKIVAFTRLADAGIADIGKRDVPMEEIPSLIREIIAKKNMPLPMEVIFKRPMNNGEGMADFSMDNDESAGTAKMFCLSGMWLDILAKGGVAFVDEIEAKLHPLLTRQLVRMFNSSDVNPHGAQLVFVTHDTNLLAYGDLRRDQIWFCEKNRRGESTLYSLAEIKDPDLKRKNALVEENYIKGRYGAVPFFGGMEALTRLLRNGEEDGEDGHGQGN